MSELEVNNKINLPSYQQKVICEIFLYLPKRYQVKKEHRRKIHNFEIAHVFSSKFLLSLLKARQNFPFEWKKVFISINHFSTSRFLCLKDKRKV